MVDWFYDGPIVIPEYGLFYSPAAAAAVAPEVRVYLIIVRLF